MLLEKLCNANGVSGNEKEVRLIIEEAIKPYADELTVDSMGNLIAKKYGKNHDKTVMLSAHTDEVGFIISGITKDGYLQFKKDSAQHILCRFQGWSAIADDGRNE